MHSKAYSNAHSPILLASSSSYRASILQKLGLAFTQASPDIDETPIPLETPDALVERLSHAKALALRNKFPAHIIIASDQVASMANGNILGKPHTVENAEKQLAGVAGQEVKFYTGLCVLCPPQQTKLSKQPETQVVVDTYSVFFKDLSEAQISAYVQADMPLDCAGSFKSEGLGITLFEKLVGNDPNTLIGLPTIKLCKLLENIGVDVLLSQQA